MIMQSGSTSLPAHGTTKQVRSLSWTSIVKVIVDKDITYDRVIDVKVGMEMFENHKSRALLVICCLLESDKISGAVIEINCKIASYSHVKFDL